MYFWTKEDALHFVNGIRRMLPQRQVAIQDEPVAPAPHHDDMSPVVQKLENVAFTDPSYQHGRARDSSSASFPGPPILATPQSMEASNFAPLAYNPAAPAAPETIQHREKTPPPEDGAENPLVAAAASEHGQTYGGPFQTSGGFSGPPQQPPQQQSNFPAQSTAFAPGPPPSQPPPSAVVPSPFAGHFQHSFAPPPTAPTNTSSTYATSLANAAPGPPAFSPQHQQQTHTPVTQFANHPGSPGLSSPSLPTPGIGSPGFQSPGIYSPATPPGGFSQYNYASNNTALSGTKPLMNDYSLHQQVYRPTEFEAKMKRSETAKPLRKGSRVEASAGAVEKSVSGFLKKLEKKIG